MDLQDKESANLCITNNNDEIGYNANPYIKHPPVFSQTMLHVPIMVVQVSWF